MIEQCIPEIEKVTAGVVYKYSEKGGRLIYLGVGLLVDLVFWTQANARQHSVSPEMVVESLRVEIMPSKTLIEGAEDDETFSRSTARDLGRSKRMSSELALEWTDALCRSRPFLCRGCALLFFLGGSPPLQCDFQFSERLHLSSRFSG